MQVYGSFGLYSLDTDPRTVATDASKGTTYLYAPAVGKAVVMQKQDNGLTTNWSPVGGSGITNVTRNLYVDNGRTDVFIPDGSQAFPFATIGDAINQIITNADNGANAYVVTVMPGIYPETLTLNSALLFNIFFVVGGGAFSSTSNPVGTVVVSNPGGNVLVSTLNNNQLDQLTFAGFVFHGSIVMTGDTNLTNFGGTQILFSNCFLFLNGAGIALTNINNVYFYGTSIQGGGAVFTWQNLSFAYIQGVEGLQSSTTLHLVQNNGDNQPAQGTGNYLLCSESKIQGTVTIDAGSELDAVQCLFNSTSNITNNGIIHSFGSNWNGAVTLNAGSSTRLRGDTILNAPTQNGGAVTTDQGTTFLGSLAVGTNARPVTNTVIIADNGHYKSTQTTAPTTTINGNAGTGAATAVSNATDQAGHLSLTTGAAAFAAGVQTTVNFNKAYNVAPIVQLTPTNANAANGAVSRGVFVTSTVNGFSINFAQADVAATTYTWNYQIIETQ